MEDIKEPKRIHMGRNLTKARRAVDVKQDDLAARTGMTQQRISQYEKKQVIDHETLVKFAEALNVPVHILEEMEDDTSVSVVIENNSFDVDIESGGVNNNVLGLENEVENTVTNNPLEALVEMHKEMVAIHKDMLEVLKRMAERK